MDYTYIYLINDTPQTLTLNSLTNFDDGNMFLTDGSLSVPANGGECPIVGGGTAGASLVYNITEQMVLQVQWTQSGDDIPTSCSAGVLGGTEYSTMTTGPVITADPDNSKWSNYTWTITLSASSS